MYLITSVINSRYRNDPIAILAEVENVLPDVNTTISSLNLGRDMRSVTNEYLPLYFLKVKNIIRIKTLDGENANIYINEEIVDYVRSTIENSIIITILESDSYLFDGDFSDTLERKFESFNNIGGSLEVRRFADFSPGEHILYGINNETSLKYAASEYYIPESKTLILEYNLCTFASSTFVNNARELLRFITPSDVSILSMIYAAGKKVYKDVPIENMSFPLLEYRSCGKDSSVSISICDMWDRMYEGDPSLPLEKCNIPDIEAFLENPAAYMLIPNNLKCSITKYLKSDVEVMRLCGSKETGSLQEMAKKVR